MKIQTLEEAGYPGRPYIHNDSSDAVCFVWFSKSKKGRVCKDLAWTIFRLIGHTGKLVNSDGYLVPAMEPTEHYSRSQEELFALAQVEPPIYPLRNGKQWVGPFLHTFPCEKPKIGQKGLNYLLMERPPLKRDGVPISYGFGAGFAPTLQLGHPA